MNLHKPQRLQEPIVVSAKQHGFFPKAFVWRGQRHDICAVEDCHTEIKRSWRGPVQRHYFRVRTELAVYEIVQDLARDLWHLEQMWAPRG